MTLSCNKKAINNIKKKYIKNNGDFYFLNCLHSFRTKCKLESHKGAYEIKNFCNVNMPCNDTKMLKFNQYQNLDKAQFIYADLECIIEKTDECKNNSKNLSTTKVSKNISSGFSMYTISSLRSIKSKDDVYRAKDCMEKFYGIFKTTQWK